MSSTEPRVGVLLVGGFLGAGKTTLLSRLVRDPSVGPRLAVLVNELGSLGLDGELVRAASESASLRTVQLDSGCLCCTLKGELGEALLELARPASGPPPAQIVVELSGAALASEVHFQVATQALEAPYFADGLVCVVDAHQAQRWAKEAEGLFVDQLARADLVLLSKLDLATDEERAGALELIARLAPQARVVPSSFGAVAPSLLLGMHSATLPSASPQAHAHALIGETVCIDGPVSQAALEAMLEDLSSSLFRIKGVVEVRAPEGPRTILVQCVGDQITLEPFSGASSPARLTFIGPADAVDGAVLRAAVERMSRA